MKKFSFRLQPLLNIKHRYEKQTKNELAQIDQKLFMLEEELAAMKREFLRATGAYRDEMQGGLAPQKMMWYTHYFEYLKEQMWKKRDEIETVRMQRRECQRRLVEIMREIKVLDKLKEHHYQEYLHDVQLEQERELGDIISYRASAGNG